VHDDEIGHILQQFPLKKAASMLVDLANLRGGHDNITLIIVGIP
jgi:serine/threonine protein phosphatase PrpC